MLLFPIHFFHIQVKLMVLSIVSSLHPVWICNCFFEGAYFLFHVVDYKIHLGRVLGFSDSSVGKESTCNVGDPSLIPRSRKSTGEGIGYELQHAWASLVAQLVRICLQCRRPGLDPWVGKIPWRRERLPTLVFWPGEFCGVCNPWGHKKSDMTEWLSYLDSICISETSYHSRKKLSNIYVKWMQNNCLSLSGRCPSKEHILCGWNFHMHWNYKTKLNVPV